MRVVSIKYLCIIIWIFAVVREWQHFGNKKSASQNK